MNKKAFSITLSFVLPFLLIGCHIEDDGFGVAQQNEAYVPVYGEATASDIVMTSPQSVNDPGKIYVYENYLLVNEKNKGIHIFDNTDPANPVNLGFLQLLGNHDMAIKDGVLYGDHLGNLVALTTNDFTNVQEKGRLPLRNWELGVPPPSGFHFECVDPDKGLVIGWKKTQLKNPNCYAY